MEWVETTAKTLEDAKDLALDRLGVAADEAEFDVLEEPRNGLFGRTRGEARVRARVMPAAVRPKQERRNRGRNQNKAAGAGPESRTKRAGKNRAGSNGSGNKSGASEQTGVGDDSVSAGNAQRSKSRADRPSKQQKENKRMDAHREHNQSQVTPQEVGDAATEFMGGLASAFGVEGTTDLDVDGVNLAVNVAGSELGLMVGPAGRTLMAIQDLARVASQRRLGDHETRLRIDVGGYRQKRREALERFAGAVAAQVIESGSAKALEPMSSIDRKTVHDAVVEIDGVDSHSEGDDPARRVVITPA